MLLLNTISIKLHFDIKINYDWCLPLLKPQCYLEFIKTIKTVRNLPMNVSGFAFFNRQEQGIKRELDIL
jgi:hypothetical protein